MTDLAFISDVIYGLKIEYGESVTFSQVVSETVDLTTGRKSQITNVFTLNLVIPLPTNLRQKFLRSIALHKEGYLQDGEREFLIDNLDLPLNTLLKIGDKITWKSGTYPITKIENYEYAQIIRIQEAYPQSYGPD